MSLAQGVREADLEARRNAFKLAHGKFPPRAAHELSDDERERLRREAVAFIRDECFREGATHYQLLNVGANAPRDAIRENYQLLMALIHPDRAEGAREAWPAQWAQRANHAYAVLSDPAARAEYDASLIPADPFPPRPHRAIQRRARRGSRVFVRTVKAAFLLSLVAVMLVVVDAWIDAQPQSGFAGATRGRDVAASAERPRFLGTSVIAAREWVPDVPAPPPPKRERAKDFQATPNPPPVVARQAEQPAVVREASVIPAELPAPAPLALAAAPAPAPAAAAEATPTGAQIEIVVARLIGYYEAGETDNLMSLLDAREAGPLQSARMRQAYGEFFRATRQRRLLVKSLDWQEASASARARGEATVQADYVDARGSLEREVPVEMEIALRNGQAKITRLTLYPNAP